MTRGSGHNLDFVEDNIGKDKSGFGIGEKF
jgi:hypothetical protein